MVALLQACGGQTSGSSNESPINGDSQDGKYDYEGEPSIRDIDVNNLPDAVPQEEPVRKAGNENPYTVLGKTYWLRPSLGYRERGIASRYGQKSHGQKTANGEVYSMYAMTGAHKTLPIPSYVKVTNLDNGLTVVVRINDRGPFHGDRIIDLSYAAAKKLAYSGKGVAYVEVEAIDPKTYKKGIRQVNFKQNARLANNAKSNRKVVLNTKLDRALLEPHVSEHSVAKKAEPQITLLSKTEPSIIEPPKTESSKTEPSKIVLSKTEPSIIEPPKTVPSKTESSKKAPSPVATTVKVKSDSSTGQPSARLYLQLGAFSSESNAENFSKRLRGTSSYPVVVHAETVSKTLFKVLIGPVENKRKLVKLKNVFEQAENISGFVVYKRL